MRRLEFIQGNGVSIEEELEKRRNSEREQQRVAELNLLLGDQVSRAFSLLLDDTHLLSKLQRQQ